MKTKINPTTLLVCALCFGACSSLTARAEVFIRPGVLYVDYTYTADSTISGSPRRVGYSDKSGISLAVGTSLGQTQQHEISLEVLRARWSRYDTARTSTGLGSLGMNANGSYMPFLANYRYRFGSRESRVGAYAGGSVGVIRTTGFAENIFSGRLDFGGPINHTALAYGPVLGLTGKISQKISCDFSFRYLKAQDFEVATRERSLTSPYLEYSGSPAPNIQIRALSARHFMFSVKYVF